MTEWWEALSSLGKVFACIAIPATLVLLIQTILSIIGLSGSDGDADVPDGGIDIDGDGIIEDIVTGAGDIVTGAEDIVGDVIGGADDMIRDIAPGERDNATETTTENR